MSIYKYKKNGKTYYGFYVYIGTDPETGKRKRTNRRGFERKKDAEIAYARLRNGIDTKVQKERTFQEVYDDWMAIYRTRIKASSYYKISTMFRLHILPEFGDLKINRITPAQIERFVLSRYAVSSQFKEEKNYTAMVFRYAVKHGDLTDDPTLRITTPKRRPRLQSEKDENFYTPEQLNTFLQKCKEDLPLQWYAFFRLMAYTGMRRGEMLALTWADIDLKNGFVEVSKTLTRGESGLIVDTPKTTTSFDRIAVDPETVEIMRAYREATRVRGGADLVFPNGKGRHMSLTTPIKYMNLIITRYGLKRITPHGLRHTHCYILFLTGATLKDVQARMRHANPTTTLRIYAHTTTARQREIADRFSSALNDA